MLPTLAGQLKCFIVISAHPYSPACSSFFRPLHLRFSVFFNRRCFSMFACTLSRLLSIGSADHNRCNLHYHYNRLRSVRFDRVVVLVVAVFIVMILFELSRFGSVVPNSRSDRLNLVLTATVSTLLCALIARYLTEFSVSLDFVHFYSLPRLFVQDDTGAVWSHLHFFFFCIPSSISPLICHLTTRSRFVRQPFFSFDIEI